MSCEVKLLSNIDDLSEVQEQFGLRSEENWLNAVSYALSPAGDILAFGHGSILVVLASRWDRQRQLNVYKTVWRGAIDDPNRIITSILCTPIVGQGQSSQSMVDFSYIIVGLDSGQLLFYGENGTLIHSQIFQQEPIQALKAQSGKHINEELYVMYPSCSVILQGSQVFPLLRSLRQQINRYGIGSPKVNEAQETIACRKWSYEKGMTIVDAVVVGPQKSCTFDHLLTASLEGGFFAKYRHSAPQNSLIIATGSKPYVGFHYAKEGFTQPVLADVARAVASKIKSALPSWLGGGGTSAQQQATVEPQLPPSEPLICRFGLCDLQRNAFAVWLAPNYQLAAVADNLGRVILVDCQRGLALRIWKGYRDAQCGFVEVPEKLPKESSSTAGQSTRKLDRRKALFLVIYAPRRSVLEVWSLRSGGPKVAAFTAAKNGQLIYNTHSQMGITSGASKIKYTGHGCTFLDLSDSSLKEIVIPFHCALSDAKSKVAKDLHLLKRLKICLKTGDGSEAEELEEMSDMCRNFETDEIRLQCVEMLAKQRKIRPKLFAAIVDIFAEVAVEGSCMSTTLAPSEISTELEEADVEEDMDVRSMSMQAGKSPLRVMCENYQKLVMFYQYLHGDIPSIDMMEVKQMKDVESPNTAEDEQQEQKVGEKQVNVKLSEQELTVIEQLIELIRMNETEGLHAGLNGAVSGIGPSTARGVKFDESAASGVRNASFMEYLSSFNVMNDDLILLREESGPNAYASLGKIIFERLYRFDQHRLVGFVASAEACGMMPEDLLRLFLAYWLRLPFTYRDTAALVDDLNRFSAVLHQICLLAREKTHFENNALCLWWQSVREYLLESPCALRGLLAALMCRNEALRHENRRRSDDAETEAADEQFEQVSQEACQWMLLIYKLEDVAILGTILADCVRCRRPRWPTLKYHKPVVSLKEILTGGKGIVSELAAKWVASTGIEPAMLVIEVPQEATETEPKPGDGGGDPKANTSPSKESTERADRKERNRRLALIKANLLQTSEYGPAKDGGEQEELDPVLYNLNILRLHFPFSLDSGQLLAQLAWEYIGAWSRNMPNVACLQAGLACLTAIPRLQYSIKHGLCCMIWNAHLKIPLEATKKLVNKVGRLPKEKLCLQDIGISDALVPQFLECCLEFFDQFAGSIDHDKLELRFEDLLQEGPVPLTVLATQQNSANMALLRLHQELTTTLLILTSFSVRYANKPIQQLFDGMANQAFFSEINRQLSATNALPKADQLLRKARIEFLCRTVTATMDLIREDMETVYYADHNSWMDTIERLAGAWELEFGDIRKHQIIELYAHGWDTYAHELLENVVADHTFANLLLTIAGRRLALYTKANPSSWAQIASVGPLLTDYLDTLVSNSSYGPPLRFAETDEATLQTAAGGDLFIEKITKLTEKAFNSLSSLAVNTKGTSKELRVAGMIFDACATIKDHRN
ncbi:rab3 GTPase-activating protein non-catalytic subunit [Anopheles ziemanni]|uniref:rab3 GTPase-activating protein non-catalytic subunit n=1 Tax=Anopheles coustani TaxID=139045 RepID=UPI002657F428|nr:rab3 GTPase-activating protein non-catalytic subunit [Anopheles coustani]XP_058171366.1 rab3 GTPase-activating protein non-catalytic subunit [Anopheles ziemanni]